MGDSGMRDDTPPLRDPFAEALQRRAAAQGGRTRQLLEERLSRMHQAAAVALEDDQAPPPAPAPGALAALVEYIAGQAAARPGYPELEALEAFRELWSQARTRGQVRRSLEQAPANAGPLNSGRLVHRALTLMRELSPGYLQQFLGYIDTLAWLEQIDDGAIVAAKDAQRSTGPRKRARSKPLP